MLCMCYVRAVYVLGRRRVGHGSAVGLLWLCRSPAGSAKGVLRIVTCVLRVRYVYEMGVLWVWYGFGSAVGLPTPALVRPPLRPIHKLLGGMQCER